uniref:Gustatory receptor n=1 Tax=Plectus sambesii TaxID=2011161 RepID=A0A914V3S7_9BILA
MQCFDSHRQVNDRLRTILALTPTVIKAASGASFVINIVFFVLLVVGCWNEFLPKKRYTLLANRSIIDSLMSMLTFVFILAKHEVCLIDHPVLCKREKEMVYPVPLYLLQIGLTLNYWMLSVSYSAIALLTWYAVKFPLEYRIKLTVARIIQTVVVVWVLSCVLLFAYSRLSGMEIFKSNAMIVLIGVRTDGSDNAVLGMCKDAAMNKTGRFDHLAALGLPIFGFVCTLGSYALVCVLLVQKRKINRLATRQFAGVWRLGIHIICMTFSCTLMAVAHFASGHVAESCREIQYTEQYLCEEMESLQSLFTFVAASAIGTIAWFVRMIVDPLLDVILDTRIRRALKQRMRNHHTATSSSLLMLSELRLSNAQTPVARTILGHLPSTSRTDSLYSMVSRC